MVESTEEERVEREKTSQPEKIKGIYFLSGSDFNLDEDADQDGKVLEEAKDRLLEVKAMGFNCVIFAGLDEEKNPYDEDDFFAELLDFSRKNDLYTIVDFGLNPQARKNGESLTVKLTKKYNFDSAVESIDADELFTDHESVEKNLEKLEKEINKKLDQANQVDDRLKLWFGYDDNLLELCFSQTEENQSNPKSIFLKMDSKLSDENETFAKHLSKISEKNSSSASEYLLAVGPAINIKSEKLYYENMLTALLFAEQNEAFKGGVYTNYSSLKNSQGKEKDSFLLKLSDLSKDEKDIELRVLSPEKTDFVTNESTVSFAGTSSPAFPLLCNGEKIETDELGDFLVTKNLEIGKNNFVFEQNGKKISYNISYDVKILKSVSPTGSLTAPGGTELELSAVALKGAVVHAKIGSSSIKMTQGKTLDTHDEEKASVNNSDFVSFYANYKLPASKTQAQNLGNIKFSASYRGLSKSLNGAAVKVTAKPPPAPIIPETISTTVTSTSQTQTQPPQESSATNDVTADISASDDIDSSGSLSTTSTTKITTTSQTTLTQQGKLLNPRVYNGVSGRSRMCEVKKEHCGTMALSPFNDRSNPFTTPLSKGTFDYIDGESSYEGNLYYNLRSGKRVYREDVEVILNAYNMPSNEIGLINCVNGKTTDITLSMLWKVPINSLVRGQSYAKIYNDREFGVKSFTGNSIDFVFSHTNKAVGTPNVSASNIFSRAEWISNKSNNTQTLRLHFRRAGIYYGYNIAYNSNGSLTISLKNKPASLSGHTIMLDPGHGGNDPGAICVVKDKADMQYESQINLAIALEIRKELQAKGAKVIMTRDKNVRVELADRRLLTYSKKPDLFISIHCDAATSAGAKGVSTFYYYAQSQPLANAIRERILTSYAKEIKHTTNNRNTVFYPFHVTRTEVCPAILIEYGFISNVAECRVLQNATNQKRLAKATVDGIIDYIGR